MRDKLNEAERWSHFATTRHPRLLGVYPLQPNQGCLDSSTRSTYAPVHEAGLLRRGHRKEGRPEAAPWQFQRARRAPRGLPLVTQVGAGHSAAEPLYAPAILAAQASVGVGGKPDLGDRKRAARATRAGRVASQAY